jgi:ATP-dependent helicase HrpB
VVLQAEPGAGKTTGVPPALLPDLPDGTYMVVLEPRRLAARLAAERVAAALHEPVGRRCGYQVRHESRRGPETRILFATEGILLRRLVGDATLQGTWLVALDEFHERHLSTDVCLALLRRLQLGRRPDLRLLVMSATLDTAWVADYLGGCPVLSVPGRPFPLQIHHLPAPSARPLEEQVAAAVQSTTGGHVLAFLPGAAEIRKSQQACAGLGLEVRMLHGDLPLSEQEAAVSLATRRRLVLATNVAETSVTVPGVTNVIDSGLARIMRYSVWSGLPRLEVDRISQAAATQRAGRAARTAPGQVWRLYTQADLAIRPAFETPEVRRADLAEILLLLLATDSTDLDWFEPPSDEQMAAAQDLLSWLGAVDADGVTELGRRLLAWPVHPRLGRVIFAADDLGVGGDGRLAAALLSGRDLSTGVDLMERLQHPSPEVLRLARTLGRGESGPHHAERLQRAMLAGFPDRVGYRPRPRDATVLLAGGGSADLGGDMAWFVALDVEERRDRGRHARTMIRLASAIEPDWLLEAYLERVTEVRGLAFQQDRVALRDVLQWGALPLEDRTRPAPPGPERAALLAEAAWRGALHQHPTVEAWLARWRFTAGPEVTDTLFQDALREVCDDRSTLGEVREAIEHGALTEALARRLDPGRRLDRAAPATVHLPRRPRVPVHYERDRAPWLASRLQDFFGLRQGPRVGDVPLVLHLLAPNGRAVQVTDDLAGFWQRTYPQVRQELRRRYPRHAWPENPENEQPPATSERGS